LQRTGWAAVGLGRPELDITQPVSIQRALRHIGPDILVNTAAYTAVDQAESEPEAAFAVNRDGAAHLAAACKQAHIPLVHISTDYVFDGKATRPYREEDPAAPLGVYGRSKWEGEEAVRTCHRQHLIVRTAWLYGRHGTNFVVTILRLAREREVLRVVADQHGSPTWSRDLAEALAAICRRVEQDGDATPWGTYHFCGAGQTSWFGLACTIVEEARARERLRVHRVKPIPTAAYPTPAQRPAYSVLDCRKLQATFGLTPRPWQVGIRAVMQELYS
jgi:dTDP-4-dehydrorhamnose reductase